MKTPEPDFGMRWLQLPDGTLRLQYVHGDGEWTTVRFAASLASPGTPPPAKAFLTAVLNLDTDIPEQHDFDVTPPKAAP